MIFRFTTKKIILAIIVVPLILLLFGVIFLAKEILIPIYIESQLEKANYCSVKSDCVNIGDYSVACKVLFNKNEVGNVKNLIYLHNKFVTSISLYKCKFVNNYTCVNNQCKAIFEDELSTPTDPSLKSFVGNVKTGAQLGEVKQYCKEGLYLVADEGQYLANQSTMLQLRANNVSLNQKMIGFAGFEVRVIGKYPAQEVFCQAQICACDDYILVEDISILRYSP